MKALLIGIKNVLLWSYARGTWQYDILCVLIIAAVFVVPSRFFGDRDRPMQTYRAHQAGAQANEALKIASKDTETIQWDVGVEELRAFLAGKGQAELMTNNLQEAIVLYLRDHLKREPALADYKDQRDEQKQVVGYRVWFK
jgi:hypothetical protein